MKIFYERPSDHNPWPSLGTVALAIVCLALIALLCI